MSRARTVLAAWSHLVQRVANAILGPIGRATMLVVDRETLLVQPTNSLLRAIPRVRSVINGLSGYPH
jgi:hypothetical protein